MINIKKVVSDIKNDGKYDAILDVVKDKLKNEHPSYDEILELVNSDEFFIKEYKDLNRWGELSSVHINELHVEESDTDEAKELKETVNKNVIYLSNGEEYEVKQKNVIYLAWTGFIALPSIYVIDNLVRITDMYKSNENSVYVSFILVILASIWGYLKVTKNHKNQHERYMQTQTDTRALVKLGLEREFFTQEEVYLH
ncbi:MAG: hypothetical protein KAH32_05490 [Chlamydiia bacterium]|nr:hypothetical protein [Chlamydiia bacterium]